MGMEGEVARQFVGITDEALANLRERIWPVAA